jgi:hypothetical protein
MKHGLITLLWDDSLGEGCIRLRSAYDDCGWVTKMDFLADVISKLEDIQEKLIEDYSKSEGSYRL